MFEPFILHFYPDRCAKYDHVTACGFDSDVFPVRVNPKSWSLWAECKHRLQWWTVAAPQQQDCAKPHGAAIPDETFAAVCSSLPSDTLAQCVRPTSHTSLHVVSFSASGQVDVCTWFTAWKSTQSKKRFQTRSQIKVNAMCLYCSKEQSASGPWSSWLLLIVYSFMTFHILLHQWSYLQF